MRPPISLRLRLDPEQMDRVLHQWSDDKPGRFSADATFEAWVIWRLSLDLCDLELEALKRHGEKP